MNCNEARLAIGADPGALPRDVAEHLRSCQVCSGYLREMRTLDSHIRRAFATDPPLAARPRTAKSPVLPARRWALAASVTVALLAGAIIWGLRPGDVLARDIAAHVDHEPASWSADRPMPPAAVRFALRESGVTIDETVDDVVYARTCPFRGREIPHLVVKTPRGPVTVLLLAGERLSGARRLDEHGYRGTLLPSSGGAIALLARGDVDVEDVARRVERAIRWGPVTSARTP